MTGKDDCLSQHQTLAVSQSICCLTLNYLNFLLAVFLNVFSIGRAHYFVTENYFCFLVFQRQSVKCPWFNSIVWFFFTLSVYLLSLPCFLPPQFGLFSTVIIDGLPTALRSSSKPGAHNTPTPIEQKQELMKAHSRLPCVCLRP